LVDNAIQPAILELPAPVEVVPSADFDENARSTTRSALGSAFTDSAGAEVVDAIVVAAPVHVHPSPASFTPGQLKPPYKLSAPFVDPMLTFSL
jgi:hypothetical protein